MKRRVEAAMKAFAHVNALPAVFVGTIVGFIVYMTTGQLIGFDRFPYPFQTLVLSMWAISLGQAVLFVGAGAEKRDVLLEQRILAGVRELLRAVPEAQEDVAEGE